MKGKVGLLVDPGAHDNLVGDRTMKLLSSQVKCKPAVRTLERPLSVQGVGNGSQQADLSHGVEFSIRAQGRSNMKLVRLGGRVPQAIRVHTSSLYSEPLIKETLNKQPMAPRTPVSVVVTVLSEAVQLM